MSETLEIFGREYTGVTGIKAKDDNGNLVTFIKPEGTLNVSQNGMVDVSQYAYANVGVSGGGGGDVIAPDYQGLAYSYIATNGGYFQSDEGQKYYCSYWPVESGKTYAFFVGETVSNRLRAHFYAGKSYADFSQYVTNSGTNTQIYTCTTNITGTTELSGKDLQKRFIFTASDNGELIVMTSNTSVAAISYCAELP